MVSFSLPLKVFVYLRRLLLNYEHSGARELAAIIKHGQIAVDPHTEQWRDFGIEHYGHDVVIYLTGKAIAPISVEKQAALAEKLKDDLNNCANLRPQAIVVLFTPDELAQLKAEFCNRGEKRTEGALSNQARPNVIFEAGWAVGALRRRA